MNKKKICSIARIATMAISLTMLRRMYDIGVFGFFLVCLTGAVWAITVDIENED